MSDNDYDAFAAAYDADNETNAWNAHYEPPAILSLAGDVHGLRVLDAGCGGGARTPPADGAVQGQPRFKRRLLACRSESSGPEISDASIAPGVDVAAAARIRLGAGG